MEYKARALTWDSAPNKKIFGEESAISSALGWEILIDHMRFPFIIFNFLSSQSNPENRLMKEAKFKATIVVKHDNDRLGRLILDGGGQDFNYGASEGKGLLQLQEKLFNSLNSGFRPDGIFYSFLFAGENLTAGAGLDDAIALGILEIDIDAILWEESSYLDVFNFTGTLAGGAVTLTWQDPPDRYDLIQTSGLIIRRKIGSNPTSVTDGIAVGTVNIGVQTYIDAAPGAGDWFYGIFVSYDENNDVPSSATNYSSGKFKEIVVV